MRYRGSARIGRRRPPQPYHRRCSARAAGFASRGALQHSGGQHDRTSNFTRARHNSVHSSSTRRLRHSECRSTGCDRRRRRRAGTDARRGITLGQLDGRPGCAKHRRVDRPSGEPWEQEMNPVATTPVTADPGAQMLAHVSRLTVQPGGPSPLADSTRAALRETRFGRDVLPLDHQLFGAAMRLTRNRQDAEDLVQEVMRRAYAGFGSFRDGTSIKAWLYRIMHNTWISQYRRRSHRPRRCRWSASPKRIRRPLSCAPPEHHRLPKIRHWIP